MRMPRRFLWVALIFLLILAVAAARYFRPPHRTTPPEETYQAAALEKLAGAAVEGWVVYERIRPDRHLGIWKTRLGSTPAYRLTREGRYPRISPDGRHVAFVRGNHDIMLMNPQGRFVRRLARAANHVSGIAYHPNGREVLFIDGKFLRAVEIHSRKIRLLQSLEHASALDISHDGLHLVAATNYQRQHEIYTCVLPEGDWQHADRGCSAAISADGKIFTDNSGDHRQLLFRRFADHSEIQQATAPKGLTNDNEAWSNQPDWICYVSEHINHRFVWIYQRGQPTAIQASFTRDADRPDLFLFPAPPPQR